MQLVPLPPDRLAEVWHRVQPFAEKIEQRFKDEWPARVILEAAHARELQLWLVWDETKKDARGVVGTRIIAKASGKRVLDIAWMAGEGRKDWMGLLPILEAYAADEGCVSIGFLGRWGWQPDLPGYSVKRLASYEKDLAQWARTQQQAA